MSELEQWCEIDGHTWLYYQCSYGLVLGSKTIHTIKICSFCKTTEESVNIPKDHGLDFFNVLKV